ncbi:Xaa-Pro aminopeptidase 2 [Galemys pyrenaicus]|uniref:Xaa-Pro aminopeptidase 2 n=1 Tax=Galemys pyrenaicus TaxID=202257 RepID=A0A8J6DWN2_GALPY|nr:Xaa-Pro aminopeptidase 2 [Galemys pyrenaicus]
MCEVARAAPQSVAMVMTITIITISLWALTSQQVHLCPREDKALSCPASSTQAPGAASAHSRSPRKFARSDKVCCLRYGSPAPRVHLFRSLLRPRLGKRSLDSAGDLDSALGSSHPTPAGWEPVELPGAVTASPPTLPPGGPSNTKDQKQLSIHQPDASSPSRPIASPCSWLLLPQKACVCVCVCVSWRLPVSCQYLPVTAVNTTVRLIALRQQMQTHNLSAYLIPETDAHMSEYIGNCDKRRAWMTGFTGSAGTAVVTMGKAALWTDSRYWTQAERQMDCNWELHKQVGTSPIVTWLLDTIPAGARVGFDPFLFSIGSWESYNVALQGSDRQLVSITTNLVDQVWGAEKPPVPSESIYALQEEFTGSKWQDKVTNLRSQMKEHRKAPTAVLLSALDETAWLFNLRGKDIPYNPFFYSYALLTHSDIRLFVNKSRLHAETLQYLNSNCKEAMCVQIEEYGQVRDTVQAYTKDDVRVWIGTSYTTYGLYEVIPKVGLPGHSPGQLPRPKKSRPKEKLVTDTYSPVMITKAVKNSKEQALLRATHVRDAVAVIRYLFWLEQNVPKGTVNEFSGAELVDKFRGEENFTSGSSFETISASGLNAALAHYSPTKEQNRKLSTDEMYLLDSGGQYWYVLPTLAWSGCLNFPFWTADSSYMKGEAWIEWALGILLVFRLGGHHKGKPAKNSLSMRFSLPHPSPLGMGEVAMSVWEWQDPASKISWQWRALTEAHGRNPAPPCSAELDMSMFLLHRDGTTDITRTVHWGTPSAFQKEAYTRVLMGNIDLSRLIFPAGTSGRVVEAFARRALWDIGLNYGHGTGHGIGNFLCVHEWPVGFQSDNIAMAKGMFTSIEPGYYQDGEFGIRLEDVALVVEAKTKYSGTYLTFEVVSLVPYDRNLIEVSLLSPEQLQYLNDYYQTIQEKVGPELQRRQLHKEFEWLQKQTEPLFGRARSTTSLASLVVFSSLAVLGWSV